MSSLTTFLGAPWREFFQFLQIPTKLKRMSFLKRNAIEQEEHNLKVSGTDLKKHLGWFSYACIGWGTMVAIGIFRLIPKVYAEIAGPSIILSILIVAMANITTGLLFSELSVEYPIVGGAYVYVLNIFGELPAMMCAANMILYDVHGASAVVRNFSYFFAVLIGKDENPFQLNVDFQKSDVDYLAAIVIGILCIVAIWSTKVFSRVNIALQVAHVILVFVVIFAAFSKADRSNFEPFFYQGKLSNGKTNPTLKNVLEGASNVVFMFIGFDTIALAAEEAKSPSSVPIGIMSSIISVTITYILMTLATIMLIPAGQLYEQYFRPLEMHEKSGSGYSPPIGGGLVHAFVEKNMKWAKYVTALAALIGIFSSAGLYAFSLSRVITVLSREGMIPAIGAYVSPKTFTPVVAVASAGLIAGSVSFFTNFESLSRMTTFGTLTMYWFVSISYIYKRYTPPELDDEEYTGNRHLFLPFRPDPFFAYLTPNRRRSLVLFYIFMITMCPVGYSIYLNESDSTTLLVLFFVLWFVFTLLLQFTLPICYVPKSFALPWYLVPWIPSVAAWTSVMLVGSFEASKNDYIKLFVTMAAGVFVYILFGVHASHWRFYGMDDLNIKEDI